MRESCRCGWQHCGKFRSRISPGHPWGILKHWMGWKVPELEALRPFLSLRALWPSQSWGPQSCQAVRWQGVDVPHLSFRQGLYLFIKIFRYPFLRFFVVKEGELLGSGTVQQVTVDSQLISDPFVLPREEEEKAEVAAVVPDVFGGFVEGLGKINDAAVSLPAVYEKQKKYCVYSGSAVSYPS